MDTHTDARVDEVNMAGGVSLGQLVRASAGGSEAAWNELVRRYSPLVTAIARSHHLTAEDARDICQTVWLRLVEHGRAPAQPART
jgi:DNA-directed RNA polymerase specialized sigma24 family protein